MYCKIRYGLGCAGAAGYYLSARVGFNGRLSLITPDQLRFGFAMVLYENGQEIPYTLQKQAS